ncbi:hypothetical protein Q4I28_008345 [Leishmania naiffi]|uniref:Secreted protein n=1 Tax=Leishmania naiffi TaxID=5678 RepID=A0AAW3B3E6_9TRYP
MLRSSNTCPSTKRWGGGLVWLVLRASSSSPLVLHTGPATVGDGVGAKAGAAARGGQAFGVGPCRTGAADPATGARRQINTF